MRAWFYFNVLVPLQLLKFLVFDKLMPQFPGDGVIHRALQQQIKWLGFLRQSWKERPPGGTDRQAKNIVKPQDDIPKIVEKSKALVGADDRFAAAKNDAPYPKKVR